MAAKDQKQAHQLPEIVAAQASIDPNTPIRVSSPEFARVPSLLAGERWEWMLDSGIEDYGLSRRDLLYPHSRIRRAANESVSSSEAVATFTRDCWEMYCENNAFKVGSLELLPELLGWSLGGEGVMERHLKRVYISINMFEIREGSGDTGMVGQHLAILLGCPKLVQVTIELRGEHEGERDLMMRVLEEEVLPAARKIQERVHHVLVEHFNSWWSSGLIADWRVASLDPNVDPYMHQPDITDYRRDDVDRRRKARQFEDM
jgi:hypothetical protein